MLKYFKREISELPSDFPRLYLYALFYIRRVKDALYPWDLGYGKNTEWINLLNIFDSIEGELEEWGKKKEKQDELESGNYIPPAKGTIKDKIEALGKKAEKQREREKNKDGKKDSIEIHLPWAHTKKSVKTLKKLFGI